MMHRILLSMSLSLLLLSGCAASELSRQDSADLQRLREVWTRDASQQRDIIYDVIMSDPADLAAQSAARGDYRVIALAIGYKARPENAQPVGVECSGKGKAPVQPLTMGCVPPPPVLYRQMSAFNRALIMQPQFPANAGCRIDDKFDTEMQEWEQRMKAEKKERAQRQLNK